MNSRIIDLTGQRFESLTVTGNYEMIQTYRSDGSKGGHKIKWECRCDCGNTLYIFRDALLKRKIQYCPECKPVARRNTQLYHIYHGIKQRCYNPKTPRYKDYGGRGIRMSDEWLDSYELFKDWALTNGYREKAGLSIDRIDNDGDYCKENCQWITISENSTKSDIGKVKAHSWMTDMYAISPSGEKIEITNITQFSRDTGLNLNAVGACLRGYMSPVYKGWIFHSNRSRKLDESVTTIENTLCKKPA